MNYYPPGPELGLAEANDPSTADVGDIVTKKVVRLGISTDGELGRDPKAWQTFTASAGEQPTVELKFYAYGQALDTTLMKSYAARGETPMVGWMPQDGTDATVQSNYTLTKVINGTHDAYMTTFLNAVKALGFPVMIRWAHEMNGNWYPWSEGVNTNTTGQYVTAWRHVVDLARSLGVTNVQWVWSPTTNYAGSIAISGLYPGDTYVDVIGVNGYNFGATGTGGWRTPSQLFDPTVADIAKVNTGGKPVWVTEVGCAPDDGGSKATWFGQLADWLVANDAAGVVYYDVNAAANNAAMKDWRPYSSPAAGTAFGQAIAKLRTTTRPSGPDPRRVLAGTAELAALAAQVAKTPGSAASMWAANGCETMPRYSATGQFANTSGQLRLGFAIAPTTVTINTLVMAVGSGTAAGLTLARLVVYRVNADGTLTKLAQTASSTTQFQAAAVGDTLLLGLNATGGFPTELTITKGTSVALGMIQVGTTPCGMFGANAVATGLKPVMSANISGQTDAAASYAANNYSPFYQLPFLAGTYL